jgi:hypothetical protein
MRLLPLALVATIAAACSSSDPCSESLCVCEAEEDCAIDCDDVDCGIACADVSNCDVSCGDVCDYECVDASNCSLLCDDACTATCDAVSNCEIDCGADCDVACIDVSDCRVTMVSGLVSCTNVSDCDIACAIPGGTEPATSCGEGLFACGPCP